VEVVSTWELSARNSSAPRLDCSRILIGGARHATVCARGGREERLRGETGKQRAAMEVRRQRRDWIASVCLRRRRVWILVSVHTTDFRTGISRFHTVSCVMVLREHRGPQPHASFLHLFAQSPLATSLRWQGSSRWKLVSSLSLFANVSLFMPIKDIPT
jgi:hypothetical protein